MKQEFIIRVLTKASRCISQEQSKKLKLILDEELYNYALTTVCTDLVPINNMRENISLFLADKQFVQNLSKHTVSSYFYNLNKFAKTITKDVDKIDANLIKLQNKFEDANDVATWAREYVLQATELGLMSGDGTNFSPKGNLTREQLAVVAVKLYEALAKA